VLLLVDVNERGGVDAVQVRQSSGHGALDAAAVAAVRGWEFEPARRGDTPVASRVALPIRFNLE